MLRYFWHSLYKSGHWFYLIPILNSSNRFMRKVYGLLSVQLALTTLIASVCLFTPAIKQLVHDNSWLLMVAFISSFALLIALHIKSRETPINLILLAAFVCESLVKKRHFTRSNNATSFRPSSRLTPSVSLSPSTMWPWSSRRSS